MNTYLRTIRRQREAILPSILLACCIGRCLHAEQVNDRYWQLGVGAYFSGLGTLTELDIARYDWLYLGYGNISASKETTEMLNRFLKINPNLKILIRVWPTLNLGDLPENRYQATFLHYLYKKGVKEKIHQRIHYQIRVVLDHISKPENVIGSTFLEELPGHFSGSPFSRNLSGGKLTWDLEHFRKEIEAERGKPLVWDIETRRWWAKKWVQVINEIHASMKKATGNRLVFYYLQTNHSTLDMLPKGSSIDKFMLMPHRWSDVIKTGLCDGFFAYPNNEKIWNDKYVAFARKNNWLMFSQVSHPSGMRLCPWETNVKLAKTSIPQNLGYFFFCMGNCAANPAWNADKGIPRGSEWNTRDISEKLHMRRHLALEEVGMEIVRRQPPLELEIDLPLDKAKPDSFIHPRVIVRNRREPSFYLDPAEAVAEDVTVTLKVPKGFSLPIENSPPSTLQLGSMKSGQRLVADWWVKVSKDYKGKIRSPFVITARAKNSPEVVVEANSDTSIPYAQPQMIGIPGTQWLEASYRLPYDEVKPAIVIEALTDGIRNPAVGDESVTISYRGVLDAGQRLVLDPEKGARLFSDPLVDDDGASRNDKEDPTGFRPFTEGYLLARASHTRAKVDPAVPLLVTISGKAADGGQSLVVLRYRKKKGHVDQSILVNRFSSEWRTVSQKVQVPPEAKSLQNVFLYRFKVKGKVWYGPLKVERLDAKSEGTSVSDRLGGSFPSLSQSTFRVYHYTDDNPSSAAARVRVQLVVPPPEKP